MNIKRTNLLILLLFFSTALKAQELFPGKKEAVYNKYKAEVRNRKNTGEDTLLVQLNRPLTASEIEKLKPLRGFSANHFVIREKDAASLASIIVYQDKVNALWKASDKLAKLWEVNNSNDKYFTIRVSFDPKTTEIPAALQSLKSYTIDYSNSVITAEIQLGSLLAILEQKVVLFADIVKKAREEIVINGTDPSVNDISAVHSLYPAINGNGITLSLKEGMFNKEDIDLAGNITALPNGDAAITAHATIMATLALGRGNSFIRGLGAAPAAKLTSSDFKNLMPDDIQQLNNLKVSVQNHSYGTDIDNLYGIEAVAYDKQVFEADTLIHVFSAGNIGTATPSSGTYKGLANTANLTGDFKQAKNVLVTGGINRENIPETLSSKGPAYDGRVKPELVALGEDGTSGAAAITSGVVALLQQQYKNLYSKQPSAAVIRSILLNSADDLGNLHVDYVTGFGKLNALKSLQTIAENRFKSGILSEQEEFSFPLQIPANQRELKVTLAWIDPPAAINSVQSIVNHLDLSMKTPSGAVILPWVLSTYPHKDSLALPAVRKIDNVNTVQQLTLENVPEGTYTIQVKGRKVPQGKQAFSIAYQLTAVDSFSWSFPVKDAAIFATEDNYLRWNSTFTGQTGKLSISYDNGANWVVLSANTDLGKTFYKWAAPDLFTRAILKMEINGKEFKSQSFIVSKPAVLNIGYNCSDKLLFHWKPQPGATGYTLYNLKNNILVPLTQVTDTIIEVSKSTAASSYFALSANGQDFNGIKSYTLNYTDQGIACYVKTLTGNAVGDLIKLDLTIGTTYNLKRILWEKQSAPGVFNLLTETAVNSGQLAYSINDEHPRIGIQYYRVTFETNDGLKVQSDPIAVTFLKQSGFVTYPNPVTDYLSVLSGDFEPYTLSLYNLSGQKVFFGDGTGANQFNISSLSAGIYIGSISRNGNVLKTIKIIKQ